MVEAYHLNALPPGTMLQEYEVLRVLGEGGFGIVYLTKGRYLDDLVAIKEYLPAQLATRVDGTTITPTSSANQEFFSWGRQKFLEEARMLSQLSSPRPHPNIVAVRRFFELHGTAYLVMDYEQGEALSVLLEREGCLEEAHLAALTEALLDGLETVHAAGITHRDIKPSNILVRADGTPVLLDFGAARLALGERTQSSFNAVSPAYAAPEQLMGSEKVGPWTDLYGLGATLYRAATGRLPQPAVERLVEEGHLPASELAGAGYTAGLLRAIDAALALRAEDRPQSVSQWRALMAAPGVSASERTVVLGAGAPAAGPGPVSGGEGGTAVPRRRTLAAALGIGALVVALGAALGAYQFGGWGAGEPPQAEEQETPAARQAAQEAERQAQEQARLAADRARWEAEARRQAEAQRQAEERARLEEAQRRAQEQARREAEARRQAEAQREAEEEARRRAEEQARLEEAQRQAEEQARREAEAQARREEELARQEAQRAAEEQARRETEARQQAEEQARRDAAAAAARLKAKEQLRLAAQEEAQRYAEAQQPEATQERAEPGENAAQEARLRAEAAEADIERRIAELRTYVEQNRTMAERQFKAFVAEGKVLEFRERFGRVLSFGDIVFENSEYRLDVHYTYCRTERGGCQTTSRQSRFAVRLEDGKLLFRTIL